MNDIKLLDVVALLEDLPTQDLRRGQVGTVVEVFVEESNRPGGFLVEFSDRSGETSALADLRPNQLMKLHYQDAERDAA
jgi:hypothetical protein